MTRRWHFSVFSLPWIPRAQKRAAPRRFSPGLQRQSCAEICQLVEQKATKPLQMTWSASFFASRRCIRRIRDINELPARLQDGLKVVIPTKFCIFIYIRLPFYSFVKESILIFITNSKVLYNITIIYKKADSHCLISLYDLVNVAYVVLFYIKTW